MSVLATPLRLSCGLTLGNRLVKSAMAEQLATAHRLPTPRHERLYDRWARGGAGLVVTGNVMVDPRHPASRGDVAIRSDALGAFTSWSSAVRRHGTPILMQLNHPGRQAPRSQCRDPVAPSAVTMERAALLFAPPRALSPLQIEAIVDRFATAAAFAERAGFDGVEVHAAHGYLVSQFLSPRTNVRRDAWGGSPAARERFLVEIVRAIRRATSPHFALAVKLNATDFLRGGLDVDASLAVAHRLEDEGIDLLEITGGTYDSDELLGRTDSTSPRTPYFVDYVRRLAPRYGVPLLLTGGHRDRATMEALVGGGVHDLVGLARPTVLHPDFPARILSGDRVPLDEPRFPRVPGVVSMLALRWYTERIHRLADLESPGAERCAR